VNRPRAADDFEVIRERLEELRRQRAEIESEERSGDGASIGGTEDDAEKQGRAHREGAPPAWVPTIFLPQPTD